MDDPARGDRASLPSRLGRRTDRQMVRRTLPGVCRTSDETEPRQKGSLTAAARENIRWIAKRADLPPDVLLHASADVVEKIFSHQSGTTRTDELFRLLQRQRIGRGVVAAVAQQEDTKRVRYNGGSRSALQKEGIIVLGQYRAHAAIAEALGLPVPGQGESVSCRVVPSSPRNGSAIDGGWWRLASDLDRSCEHPWCRYRLGSASPSEDLVPSAFARAATNSSNVLVRIGSPVLGSARCAPCAPSTPLSGAAR